MTDRKRSREDEQGDDGEFPLSKRINQLKIHSEFITNPVAKSPIYSPDLSAEENPHYYFNNKLLFDAFQDRKSRKVSF